jgi:hypothetical protein
VQSRLRDLDVKASREELVAIVRLLARGGAVLFNARNASVQVSTRKVSEWR